MSEQQGIISSSCMGFFLQVVWKNEDNWHHSALFIALYVDVKPNKSWTGLQLSLSLSLSLFIFSFNENQLISLVAMTT